MHPIAGLIADILLPATCLSCSSDISPAMAPWLCADCDAGITWRNQPEFLPNEEIQALFAAGDYDGALRDLLKAFKYEGKNLLAGSLAEEWTRRSPFDPSQFDVIVPVPMPAWKQWRRGYNQAGLLAREIGRKWGKPVAAKLSRKWITRSQTSLGRTDRFRNAANGFRLTAEASVYKSKTILLIDDVCTTGATLIACARLLKSAGAKSVYAGVIAREHLKLSNS